MLEAIDTTVESIAESKLFDGLGARSPTTPAHLGQPDEYQQ